MSESDADSESELSREINYHPRESKGTDSSSEAESVSSDIVERTRKLQVLSSSDEYSSSSD